MKAAVLGSPVAHSLSPVLHRAAYGLLGLPWTYESFDVTEDTLEWFLAGLDGRGASTGSADGRAAQWAGLSLTMPLKRAVIPLLDWTTHGARTVGAVNTVVLSRGRRLGANTDVPGMVAALAERGVQTPGPPVVLGGGATAASALAALAAMDSRDVVVVARRPEHTAALQEVAGRLGQRLDVRGWPAAASALPGAALVVSTVPSGAADGLTAAVPERPGVLFDVVYDPWPTPLAAAWSAAGGTVLGGLDLLVHQAVLQVGLMSGRGDLRAERPAIIRAMRAAGEAQLAARRA